jgi:transposase
MVGKYALSLELTDPGFDYSVLLSEFRFRMVDGGVEHGSLEKVLVRFRERRSLKIR